MHPTNEPNLGRFATHRDLTAHNATEKGDSELLPHLTVATGQLIIVSVKPLNIHESTVDEIAYIALKIIEGCFHYAYCLHLPDTDMQFFI
ncbi:hypothetical protein ACGFQG_26655 [Nocardia fluminea]|uniref:hypothetical protein n=1 Tax=Nocardia fluminea TaxID=134984 RepID=UPI00370FE7DC